MVSKFLIAALICFIIWNGLQIKIGDLFYYELYPAKRFFAEKSKGPIKRQSVMPPEFVKPPPKPEQAEQPPDKTLQHWFMGGDDK